MRHSFNQTSRDGFDLVAVIDFPVSGLCVASGGRATIDITSTTFDRNVVKVPLSGGRVALAVEYATDPRKTYVEIEQGGNNHAGLVEVLQAFKVSPNHLSWVNVDAGIDLAALEHDRTWRPVPRFNHSIDL